MKCDYIVVQAGGKGTRMGHLTANKPKGIIPVDNLPILFHLFKKYPDKHFIIICDYLHEVLQRYLKCFASVDYHCVVASGVGTCGGLKEAFSLVPKERAFLLIWSDLILSDNFQIPDLDQDGIGLSETFECRWSFIDHSLIEQRSMSNGVAGCFLFHDSSVYSDVPCEGEFVRYLSTKGHLYATFSMQNSCEVGTLLAFEAHKKDYVCRPFNSMEIQEKAVIKRPLTEQGRELAAKEENWYRHAQKMGFQAIPEIYGYDPLSMERIDGANPFRLQTDAETKTIIVRNIIDCLKRLHSVEQVPADRGSIIKCYFEKTYQRIDRIRELVPFASDQTIAINDCACVSPFFAREQVHGLVEKIADKTPSFAFIHGDSTFSNVLVKPDLSIKLIDPRGYFGDTLLYGDPRYDWAKLYYSIYGNYDQFNAKNFQLDIGSKEVSLSIGSSGYEFLAPMLLSSFSSEEQMVIRFLHALIWLSLSTYAWEDYDSVCGAFYNGTWLLNQVLKEGIKL